MVQNRPYGEPERRVEFTDLIDNSANFMIWASCDVADYWSAKFDMIKIIN